MIEIRTAGTLGVGLLTGKKNEKLLEQKYAVTSSEDIDRDIFM